MHEQLADGVLIGSVLGGLAYAKWGIGPVLIAFELGRLFERMKTHARKTPAR